MSFDSLIPIIGDLLQVPARQRPAIGLEACRTGGNNRIYIVSVDGRKVVAKQYFRHPSDPRDRLHAERSFLEYAGRAGIGCVPRVIGSDAARGVGLYEYIDGTQLAAREIGSKQVEEAATFFLKLNDPENREAASELPTASEACFTVNEHFAMVDQRLVRLGAISGSADVDLAAQDFVASLATLWGRLKERLSHARENFAEELEERCISPSDFGFHNALARPSGKLCFLDFEYAGWDDPAKMAGDFFSHPAVTVPREHFDEFVRVTMGHSRHAKALEARARLLLPLFQVKWCCIILNNFIPEFAERRKFADPALDEAAAKRGQLEKAQWLYRSIEG